MRITVNGADEEWDGGSVSSLIASRGLDPLRVAVEINGAIIPRSAFGTTMVSDSDAIEIVCFVGGG